MLGGYDMELNIGDKFGCLTVMDNGEEFNNSDYYQDILQKISVLEQEINSQTDVSDNRIQFFHQRLKLGRLKKEQRHRYKCRCVCGKIGYYSEETLNQNPKYCYRPIRISSAHTYSVKAQNATYRKRKKYECDETVILVEDEEECMPSDRYCERWNKYKEKQLVKKEETYKEVVASIPRRYAKNYDVDFSGTIYESLEILECVDDKFESEPRAYFTQSHNKRYYDITVFKKYKCKCYLCGKEQLITCDKFGIYPPTEYGYHAYNGYWSEVFCGCHVISSFQWIVNKVLQELNVNYRVEYKFSDLYGIGGQNLLCYDFAIMDEYEKVVALIECQGEQHYKPVMEFGGEKAFEIQKKNDELKKEYAKKIGISLIEIPYKKKKIELVRKILEQKLLPN